MGLKSRWARLGIAAATVCTAAGLALVPAVSASAASNDTAVSAHMRDWYAARGVPESTYGPLVDHFLRGQLMDSMQEGLAPTAVKTVQRDGFTVTQSIYADGSISESEIQNPNGSAGTTGASLRTVTPQSVGQCASTTPSHYDTRYNNCVVAADNSFLQIAFHATYDIVQGSNNDLINEVSAPYAYSVAGTADTPSLKITRKQESSSGPATATASTTYHSTKGGGSFTASLSLKVGSNKATSAKGGSW
ncbi:MULTISPECIES: hypothetical protein [unclassified Curtobacterium]|uniref:hypothetical protein n=1 Tax=unclassified Curtobacterium TaxID=257496 RepID=UPI003A80E646